MPARASSRAAGDDPAAWRALFRRRPPHVPNVHPNGREPRPVARSPVISSGAAGDGGAVAVARWRPANPVRRRGRTSPGRTSPPDHPVRDRRRGSPAPPGRSAAGTGAQIRREATRPRRRRQPTHSPIQIGAGGAGGEAEAAARGRAARRVRAGVRGAVLAVARPPAERRGAPKWPE